MPYLKFRSEKDKEVLEDAVGYFFEDRRGMIAFIKDDNFGIIHFLSDDLYKIIAEHDGVKFDLVPRDKVTAPYALSLRERYPGLGY